MDAKRAGLWTKAGPWQTYPRRMLQMRARSFALRDAFPDVLKGLISVEEALDNHSGADQLPPPTIDATAELISPEQPPMPPRPYQLTTKQGTTTFQTVEEWLAAWAKLVRGCKAAKAPFLFPPPPPSPPPPPPSPPPPPPPPLTPPPSSSPPPPLR